MQIGFIGGGNMAQALMGGIAARHADTRFVVIEPHAPTREIVARVVRHVAFHDVPSADLAACDAVVVAVKPPHVREALTSAARWLDRPLVISIAAGIRTRELAHWLGGALPSRPLVRAMPNTPALIGEGITALYASTDADAAHQALATTLLDAVGQTLWVDDEAKLDAVTAVSGSGPAYVFAFIEALAQGGVELGLSVDDARRLAVATFVGASKLAAVSGDPISVLRERVTSKGGTTHAALTHLQDAGFHQAIIRAVRAAAERSAELGDEFGKDA